MEFSSFFPRKRTFWVKNQRFFVVFTIDNRFLALNPSEKLLWTSKHHFWEVHFLWPKWNFTCKKWQKIMKIVTIFSFIFTMDRNEKKNAIGSCRKQEPFLSFFFGFLFFLSFFLVFSFFPSFFWFSLFSMGQYSFVLNIYSTMKTPLYQINRKSNFFCVHNNSYNISTNLPSILNFHSPWWRDVKLPTFSWLTHIFLICFDFCRCNQADKCIYSRFDLKSNYQFEFKVSKQLSLFWIQTLLSKFWFRHFFAKNHFSCFRRSQ